MNVGILGTGMVGATIATKMIQLGHKVKMGSRAAGNEKALEWAKANGANASQGAFADAAAFGELLFNCTSGMALSGSAQAGRRRQSGRQDPDRRLQSLGLLQGIAAHAQSLQRRFHRRAPAEGVSGTQGGESAQHPGRGAYGESRGAGGRGSFPVHVRQRRRSQGQGGGFAQERVRLEGRHRLGRHYRGAGPGDDSAALAALMGRSQNLELQSSKIVR